MWERFVNGLHKTISLKQAAAIFALCMFVAGAFAFGAAMGARRSRPNPLQNPPASQFIPQDMMPPPSTRGTFGAIDQINGDRIQMRDPRSGRTWVVRARQDTVIQLGPRQRIPFNNLRVGQRIFVVGVPEAGQPPNQVDAQFIGVVLGQPQRFERLTEPVMCWDCTD